MSGDVAVEEGFGVVSGCEEKKYMEIQSVKMLKMENRTRVCPNKTTEAAALSIMLRLLYLDNFIYK